MLILKGQTPRRTHDLLTLFNSVVALSDDWEGLRSDVLRLAEIAASSRYPDDLAPIEKSEIERFAESAQNIVAHARQVLND
jgi:HEPN domain-containing protein